MSRQTLYSIVGILFVVSGALGLVYQIIWFKYLSLFLGNTTYAQTIVLATFMGGLAIGAARWGRSVDRAKRPLLLYAWLEVGVGAYCLLYPLLLSMVKKGFISTVVALSLPSDGTPVLFLKLVACCITLLIPTILMGGTLPVLVRFISRRIEESGKNVATLYFLNSFGAVIGSLLGGFFLVRLLGLSTTIYAAAILNLVVGGAALALAKFKMDAHSVEEESRPVVETPSSERAQRLAMIVAGVSGAAAMVYEISWVRLLIPVLGSSTYSFSLMLVGFISGIAIGSLIVTNRIDRWKNLVGALAMCQLAIGASMIITLPLYARIPYYFWHLAGILARSETTYPIFLALQLVFAFVIMIVPTIFLGMSLPIAARVASRSISILGRSVGNVFSVNTLGTVIGSLLAGLVLIPLVGVRHAIEIGVLLNLCSGLLLMVFDPALERWKAVAASSLIVTAAIIEPAIGGTWSRGAMLSGVFRHINKNDAPPSSFAEFLANIARSKILYYKEGTTATVGVVEGDSYEGKQVVLIINGKADASSHSDLPTQVLLGQLPMLFQRHPHNALVIGYGSGVTVGSILTHPVASVDCVEISPEVIEAAACFEFVNHKPMDDPRTHVYVEDALAFLVLTPSRYDVIVSEPSNPWIAGIGNLYTREFFQNCRARMTDNGMMAQWFHLYEMDDETFKLVLRSFQAVFPHVTIWQSMRTDVIMIGSTHPLTVPVDSLQAAIGQPRVFDDLMRISIPDAATLLSMQMMSERSALRYAGIGDLNLEDHPRLEYAAPKAFFVNRGVSELERYDQRLELTNDGTFLMEWIREHPLRDAELFNIGSLHATTVRGDLRLGFLVLSDYIERHPNDLVALEKLAAASEVLRRPEDELRYRKRLADLQPANPVFVERYAWLKYTFGRNTANAMVKFDVSESEQLLRRCVHISKDTVDRYRVRLADLFFGTQQYDKALDQYARALQIRERYEGDPGIPQDALLLQLARTFYQLGNNDKAMSYAYQAARANPNNQNAKDLAYDIWVSSGLK